MHLALVVVIEGEGAALGWNGLGEVGAAAGGTEGHDGRGKGAEGLLKEWKLVSEVFEVVESEARKMDGMW